MKLIYGTYTISLPVLDSFFLILRRKFSHKVMKKILFWNINLVLILSLLFTSCKKDNPEPDPIVEVPEANEVNKFIWEGLATYYYWADNVPNLVNPKFDNKDNLNAFLNTYSDPEELFYDLLFKYGTIDRFSFIVDNSQEIDNWLTGISESMGFDFMLMYIDASSDDVFGYVRYVLEGSPADLAGIKRGDYFLTINGTQLTASNYNELLFSEKTYTIGMAKYENNDFVLDGEEHTMTAVEIQENPILLDTVYNIDGTNVGYLVYNGFTSAYDKALGNSFDILLNNAITELKNQGIEKLILDLRYNGGGSMQTTVYLASMIYGTNTGDVFAKSKYNDLLESYYLERYGSDYFNFYFSDVIHKQEWDIEDSEGNFLETVTTPQTTITSLNLNDLYVITSSNTASASENLINGLSAYIDVTQIGTSTVGKNVGSFTIRDWLDDNTVNPNHSWAMQPIVVKVANKDDFSDFNDGLTPNIEGSESVLDLKQLGDQDETLLKLALDAIRGNATKSAPVEQPLFKSFKSSKDVNRFSKEMYIDPGLLPSENLSK